MHLSLIFQVFLDIPIEQSVEGKNNSDRIALLVSFVSSIQVFVPIEFVVVVRVP